MTFIINWKNFHNPPLHIKSPQVIFQVKQHIQDYFLIQLYSNNRLHARNKSTHA